MELRKGKNRRSVETLGTAAREGCGRERPAMDTRTKMLSDSLAVPDWKLWKRRTQNGLEATERQTVGLAIDSELEVFKPWSLVGGI